MTKIPTKDIPVTNSTSNRKIPKSFTLLGRIYTVSYNPLLYLRKNALGRITFDTNKIELFEGSEDYQVSDETIEKAFYHELVHAILQNMGEDELNENESFVDVFAGFLHQYIKTVEF